MIEGWEMKKLGDCFRFKSGEMLTAKMMKSMGVFPVYGGNGIAGLHNEFNLSGSNVIIGRVGALCGNVRHINEKIWLTDNAFQIVDFKYKFDNAFLTYLLNFKNLRSFARQAAQPVISNSSLTEIVLEFPISVTEQQRIVSILDKAFAAIDQAKTNTQKNLDNAKDLFQSELNNIFSHSSAGEEGEEWVEKKLGELGKITSSKRIYKSDYVTNGIPFYRTKEIKELSHGKNITLELFISKEKYSGIKKSFGVPKIGDVLMSAVGTIGEILVIENNDEFYFKDGNIVWFKEFNSLDANFLKFVLTAFVDEIKNLSIGSAYSALTIEKLNEHKISVPKELKTQQKIVSQFHTLSTETKKLETIYQQKLNELEELKKSILEKAFKGELTEKEIAV